LAVSERASTFAAFTGAHADGSGTLCWANLAALLCYWLVNT
jgi:hypothetical protein